MAVTEALTEEEYEELCEPKFKYKRIQNDLAKIFANDAASCMAVHSKFLAVGTQRGRVYVFDHAGNKIAGNNIPPHAVDVNQISVDRAGDYLASCSNDGKVVIFGLCGNEHGQVVSTDRPIKSVALDPEFGRSGSSQTFAIGDRCLTLHEKGILGVTKHSLAYDGNERDGWIHNLSWHGVYILFVNETGVRLFDRSQKLIITHVTRRHDLTLRCELYPARLIWFDDRNFAIGWADRVSVCSIKENKNATSFGPLTLASKAVSINNKFVEIRYMWELKNYYVSGLSYTTTQPTAIGSKSSSLNETNYDWQELVLFCVNKQANTAEVDGEVANSVNGDQSVPGLDVCSTDYQPRVMLLEPLSFEKYALLNEDIIQMNKVAEKPPLCHQYHLAGIGDENLYFILSAHDMIQVCPCNADDHVSWLLDNGLFKKALDFAKQHSRQLTRFSVNSVGRRLLDHLLADKGDFGEAAKLCPEICATRKDIWEEYLSQFERHNKLKLLASFVPVQNPQLEPECYQSILLDFLKDDPAEFKKLVFQWSPDLYRTGALINETLRRLYNDQSVSPENHRILLSTLALLYSYERNYERALEINMKLGERGVFALIERYQLFPMVKGRIQELMSIDTDLAIRLLLENGDSLPASTVMQQLSRQPKLQLAYLDRLFSRGEGQEFADLAVVLYAEYNRPKLLPFLRNGGHYKLDKALEICRSKELVAECAFLLARGGNRKEALRYILMGATSSSSASKSPAALSPNDVVQAAVRFCQEHDDRDLWTALIDHCAESLDGRLVTALMRAAGAHLDDPRQLIARIRPGARVPDLKASLVKMLRDYNSHIDLQKGCRTVLFNDCYSTLHKLVRRINKGTGLQYSAGKPNSIFKASSCRTCGKSLQCTDDVQGVVVDDIVIFWCKHAYHSKCLPGNRTTCSICDERKEIGRR